MESHIPVLREQARALPECPGVYLWRDGRRRVIYVGKAVNLRSRVTSYFATARHDRRTRDLLSRARTIDHEATATELQALLRESALIKREQPRFNRALKVSRRPFYLKVDASALDPYLEMARERSDDGSLYFGPFRSAAVLRETMQYLHATLPLRKCKAAAPRCRPCMYHQMHTCAAPALDDVHRRRHQEAIDQLHLVLDGRSERVAQWLEAKRDHLSDLLLFERAADVQARIDGLRELLQKQAILEAAARCRWVLIHEANEADGHGRLLLVAHGTVLSVRESYGMKVESVVQWVQAHAQLAGAVKRQQSDIDSADVLGRWLSARRSRVHWVAIPEECAIDDLEQRVREVVPQGYTAT